MAERLESRTMHSNRVAASCTRALVPTPNHAMSEVTDDGLTNGFSEPGPAAEVDMVGHVVLGRYRVDRLIGQGGMGSVWEASHLTLGKRVAIKFLHRSLSSSDEALRRFDTEARAAARIKSRHAVEVHDHGIDEGMPFIVMEYLHGQSLEAAIARRGPLPDGCS